jgi:transglutaminase-like putative cysteine protease
VEVLDVDPFDFARSLTPRPTFPLVWMPWELKMLQPYLTPQEIPDTQLKEIYDYAMSFANDNKNDVLETLFAINLALFRQYQYVPGCTNLATTAFDVLSTKRGVCQDFSNLFITMARMLLIPARYVCGYIYTGNTGETRAQSDASHAWVQLYIPNVGWKGFDPTNGILTHQDHVRVGVGRNYRDVSPVTGTLYSPASESMRIDVEVADLDKAG